MKHGAIAIAIMVIFGVIAVCAMLWYKKRKDDQKSAVVAKSSAGSTKALEAVVVTSGQHPADYAEVGESIEKSKSTVDYALVTQPQAVPPRYEVARGATLNPSYGVPSEV